MVEFKLPDLGEGIHEGQVVRVLVSEGQTVAENQSIFEVETDKAAVEIPSPAAGVVAKVHVSAGQLVKVGQIMISIDDQGSEPAARAAPTGAVQTAPEPVPPARSPDRRC